MAQYSEMSFFSGTLGRYVRQKTVLYDPIKFLIMIWKKQECSSVWTVTRSGL